VASWIKSAVLSILGQSYKNLELLVVDDQSDDQTKQIVTGIKDNRMRFIENRQKGFINALMTGIREAQGEWIARMDGDDISHPHRLEKQVALVKADSAVVLCGTGFGYITPNNRVLVKEANFEQRRIDAAMITRRKKMFADATMIFRRDLAIATGLYDPEFPFNEISLWYKLLNCGIGMELGKSYYFQRIHLGGMNIGQVKANRDSRNVRKKYAPKSIGIEDRKDATKPAHLVRLSGLRRKIKIFRSARDFSGILVILQLAMKTLPLWPSMRLIFLALTGVESNRLRGGKQPNNSLKYFRFRPEDAFEYSYLSNFGLKMNTGGLRKRAVKKSGQASTNAAG